MSGGVSFTSTSPPQGDLNTAVKPNKANKMRGQVTRPITVLFMGLSLDWGSEAILVLPAITVESLK